MMRETLQVSALPYSTLPNSVMSCPFLLFYDVLQPPPGKLQGAFRLPGPTSGFQLPVLSLKVR